MTGHRAFTLGVVYGCRQQPNQMGRVMKSVFLCLALASIHIMTSSFASAQSVSLEAVDSGNYDWEGDHSSGNTYYPAGDNAAAGNNELRNFFVFDLSGVTAPVLGATLELYCPSNPPDPGDGYQSPDPSETYALWEVVTDVSTLTAGGTGLTGIFDDLGGGIAFGQVDMTAADNGTMVSIPLNLDAVASISAAAGGMWAVGGAVMTIDGTPLQLVFGYGNGTMTRRLLLDLGDAIFADGLENGDTNAWSAVTPE